MVDLERAFRNVCTTFKITNLNYYQQKAITEFVKGKNDIFHFLTAILIGHLETISSNFIGSWITIEKGMSGSDKQAFVGWERVTPLKTTAGRLRVEWISANVLQTARVHQRVPVLLNINQQKTIYFDRSQALVTLIWKCSKLIISVGLTQHKREIVIFFISCLILDTFRKMRIFFCLRILESCKSNLLLRY